MPLIATKLSRIKPSPTLAVGVRALELKAAGHDVISLGAGEPDFDTPNNIKAAAIRAIEVGLTKYTAVDGTNELKESIIRKFIRENNITYTKDQITVGCGAKQVIYNAFIATLDIDDEVIIPAPYWVSYPDMVTLAGGKTVIVKGNENNDFKLDASILERVITSKTKWIILNSPSNPTGIVYNYAELRKIADLLLKYPKIYILSDDIYEHVLYDDIQFYTLATIEPKLIDRILTVNGVSKAYAMTGWRIGYAGGPKELIQAISKVQSQSTSNPCSISQAAAVEALDGIQDYVKYSKEIFQRRRDIAVNLINKNDVLRCNVPQGAFYIFVNCIKMFGKTTQTGDILKTSNDVTNFLLTEAKVAVVAGIAFGIEGYFRISYAIKDEVIIEAISRINKACELLN